MVGPLYTKTQGRYCGIFRFARQRGNTVVKEGNGKVNETYFSTIEALALEKTSRTWKRPQPAVRPPRERRGAAAVEFAAVFPIFLLLVFGAIDVSRALMAQHKLVEASRAGCRLYAIREDVTEAEALDAVGQVMTDANLDDYTVEFSPNERDSIEHLNSVTTSVSVPYDDVSWLPSWFLSGTTLTGTCIMPGDTGEIVFDDGGGGDDPNDEPDDDPNDDDDNDDDDDDDDDRGWGGWGGRGGRGR